MTNMAWISWLMILMYMTRSSFMTLAAAAVVVPASNSALTSTLVKQGPSGICACAASTYDSKVCTTAVAAYCSGNSTADAGFCGGMLNLGQLKTNQTAASLLVGFLATTCQPAIGTVMDVCDCWKAPISDACAVARFKLCADGDDLCPAITLGLGAAPDQAAYARVYNSRTCQSNSPLAIEMVFAGIDQDTFNVKYAAKTAAAVANITGVNIDQVSYNKNTAAPVLEKKDANMTPIATSVPKVDTTIAESAEKPAADAAAQAPVADQQAVEEPVPAVPATKLTPVPEPVEPEPVAVKPTVIAEATATAGDAAAEATAKSKSFDSWATTPACTYPQSKSNYNLDRLGRPWGYNSATRASCAFKEAAAAPSPAYEDTPECSYTLTDTNALPDKLGRLWGYDSATGASCVFKEYTSTPVVAAAATEEAPAKAPAAPGSIGSRRLLLQVLPPDSSASSVGDLAVMKFTIAAADAGRARRRLLGAVQDDGEGLYNTLSKAGVPFKPSVTVSGQKLLNGDVPPSINLSPRSGVLTYYNAADLGMAPPATEVVAVSGTTDSVSAAGGSSLSLPSVVGIIVGSVVGGFAVIGMLVWCCCQNRKRKTPAERLKAEDDAAAAKLGMTKDVDSYGAVLREKFAEAQKPADQRAILKAPSTPTRMTPRPVTPPAAAVNRAFSSTAVHAT